MRFVLVHSPVVGPSTWRWVGDVLRRNGHDAIVPDLREHAVAGDPLAFARAAARATDAGDTDHDTIIVGHSGAGVVLPLVADAVARRPRRMVFVDAGIPPRTGAYDAGGDFLPTLRGLARNGVLPPWSQWWGDGALEALVHDPERRREIAAEFPQVPLDFYEEELESPTDWWTSHSAYLLLSEAYRADAHAATSFGWPVVECVGAHLDIVVNADAIAEVLVELASDHA
jgi:hypothetical protein